MVVTKSPRICGIILAAGASSRMGRDKALLPWPPVQEATVLGGSTFLSSGISRLKTHTSVVVVVAGKNGAFLERIVRENGAILCVNANPELGQLSSFKAGLQEARNQGCDAAMIAPVDRPPVAEATVAQLHAAFLKAIKDGFWATVPEFQGKHGHPLVIGDEMMEELLRAPLTTIARDIIHGHAKRVMYLPVDDPAVTLNVNTWEEYQKLSAMRT